LQREEVDLYGVLGEGGRKYKGYIYPVGPQTRIETKCQECEDTTGKEGSELDSASQGERKKMLLSDI
jgi:hypothetical protein